MRFIFKLFYDDYHTTEIIVSVRANIRPYVSKTEQQLGVEYKIWVTFCWRLTNCICLHPVLMFIPGFKPDILRFEHFINIGNSLKISLSTHTFTRKICKLQEYFVFLYLNKLTYSSMKNYKLQCSHFQLINSILIPLN